MRTGVSYMCQYSPLHLQTDLAHMRELGLDDVLVAAQETHLDQFRPALRETARIARGEGIRPVAIFWGMLNLFGGGRSSRFLLEHPEAFQVDREGGHRPAGCYVNPAAVGRVKEGIGLIAEWGYEAYFVDEPRPLHDCYCAACRQRFAEWYDADLAAADEETRQAFRHRCVVAYVRDIAEHCRQHHPDLETMCCMMPADRQLWQEMAAVAALDNLGTDIYWVNNDRDVETMRPIVHEIRDLCRESDKVHHEWLQCWTVDAGQEERIRAQGEILIEEAPDALYVWAWRGQAGTYETCDNPELAWSIAEEILRRADEA
jgi:hypothetical protein